MTPQQMAIGALAAMQAGSRMTLTRQRGVKMPPKFPRGELLCENFDGRNVYSYDPAKVIAWLHANGLVAVEILGSRHAGADHLDAARRAAEKDDSISGIRKI